MASYRVIVVYRHFQQFFSSIMTTRYWGRKAKIEIRTDTRVKPKAIRICMESLTLDIGGILEHDCLNFLFITSSNYESLNLLRKQNIIFMQDLKH